MRSRPHAGPFVRLALSVLVVACSGSPGGTASGSPSTPATARATARATPSAAPATTPTRPSSDAPASAGSAMLGPTSGALTLVEPLRDLSAWNGSVALTPAGSLAMVEAGQDLKLHALDCATSCGNPATWSDTAIDPGVAWDDPLIRARDDGSLVAVVDSFVSGQIGEYLGSCTSGCNSADSWHWSRIPLPADSTTQRAASRYFAVGGATMIIGLGSGSPMSALVCGGTCDSAASWARVKFSDAVCSAPSVAASAAGAMAFACATADANKTPSENVEVWSCPGGCTDQANWGGVTGLVAGDDLSVDVTVGPAGMVGAAVNLGRQADANTANRLGWFQCAGACGEPSSWHGIVVGSEVLYVRRVAAVTDVQARSLIAYDGSTAQGNGLLTAACVADCLKPASWSIALLDDARRVSSQIPIAPPPGCDAAVWMPDNVTDITMRGDWAAIASGYSAAGTGGTCANGLFSPSSAYRPIRSVVSVAVLGP